MTEQTTDEGRFAPLMRAAQAGDGEAYVQLLREITPRLRRAVHRRGQFLGVEDVEDVVQDILLSLHVARATYDWRRPFMPWLLAIARHRFVDKARRDARRAAHELHVEDLEVTFEDGRTNTVEKASVDPKLLRQAIEALPPGQRTAIELLKLREISLKEAAARTGTSVGALKVATHRAMTTLRRALTRE